jgi:hypothetical protein
MSAVICTQRHWRKESLNSISHEQREEKEPNNSSEVISMHVEEQTPFSIAM